MTTPDSSFASFASEDEEDDFEITFNSPLKRQLGIHDPKIAQSPLQDENVESTNIIAPLSTGCQAKEEPEKEETEEEKLKREIQEETERLRQERAKEDEERRKRLARAQKRRAVSATVKPEERDESELTEKQLLARKKREEQRKEMMKRRKAMQAQKKQQQEGALAVALGAASVFDPTSSQEVATTSSIFDPTSSQEVVTISSPISREEDTAPSSPIITKEDPSPLIETFQRSSPKSSPVKVSSPPVSQASSPKLSPITTTLSTTSLELSPIKAPKPEQSKAEEEGFCFSSLGLPSFADMTETEEAENESLLKMELTFLQKKYDKEVKARMQLQKVLVEYKKTIESLVGQKKTDSEMVDKLKKAESQSAEAEKQLHHLKKEMEVIASASQEKETRIQALQGEVDSLNSRLSENLRSGKEKQKGIEKAQQEGRRAAEEELFLWKSKCERAETQVEIFKRIADIKEQENNKLTQICDELLSFLEEK